MISRMFGWKKEFTKEQIELFSSKSDYVQYLIQLSSQMNNEKVSKLGDEYRYILFAYELGMLQYVFSQVRSLYESDEVYYSEFYGFIKYYAKDKYNKQGDALLDWWHKSLYDDSHNEIRSEGWLELEDGVSDKGGLRTGFVPYKRLSKLLERI